MIKRIVIVAFGSRGDIHPLGGLAKALSESGHSVVFITSGVFEKFIKQCGVEFFPVGDSREYAEVYSEEGISTRNDAFVRIFRKCIAPTFLDTFNFIGDQCEKYDSVLVIRLGVNNGAHMICEKLGIPYIDVALTPTWFRSASNPSWPLNQLPRMARTIIVKWMNARSDFFHPFKKDINEQRAAVGLNRIYSMSQLRRVKPLLRLAFFPDWFGMPQSDWPSGVNMVGFPLHDERCEKNYAEIDRLVETFGKPLVFTTGTGVSEVNNFFRAALNVVTKLNVPAIFVSKSFRDSSFKLPDSVLIVDYVELSYILKMAKAIIHHGGIGTCAQAIAAGIPQVVCPLQYDQPDNGWRVTSLGVGGMIMRSSYTDEEFSDYVKAVVDHPEIQKRSRELANHLNRDAIDQACGLISNLDA